MSITQGQNAEASDFINDSERDATPANDTGRVPKLESNGKLSDFFVGNPIQAVQVVAGTTLSVTTEADDLLMVWAKGIITSITSVELKYNGVTKDSTTITGGETRGPFALMYAETPGAGTHDITVESAGSIADVKIMVLKIKFT